MLWQFYTILVGCCLFSSYALDLSGCGTTKSCIFNPPKCSPTNPSCLVFTYNYDSARSIFKMEVSGGSGNGGQYVGVAFSPNGQMENSDLYYCTGDRLISGVINTRVQPTVTTSLPEGVNSLTADTIAGVAECTFERPARVTKTFETGDIAFDLAISEYHIIMAKGSINNNVYNYHGLDNRYSSGPFDFRKFQFVDDGTGCGINKGCFRNPVGCLPKSNGCKFVSWIYNNGSNTFNFEIVGGGAGLYAAIAFGLRKAMADADLYYCTTRGLSSGTIRVRNSAPDVSQTLPSGITNVNSQVTDGVLNCSFTRAASITKTISNGDEDFDLNSTSYYLLYAIGTSANGGLSYHETNRIITESTLDFKTKPAGSIGGGSGSGTGIDAEALIKAHAALMLIAWLTCASIGAIIARHFKPLWHHSKLCGEKVWFALHRAFMILAVLCTIVAFILVFVAVGRYSDTAGAHPIIGIIVTALALLNPIMALCRPHPNEPGRPIFNWAHWFVGSAARILGLVAIFLGVDLTRLNLPEWDTWVLVAFVVFHIVIEITLEVLSAIYGHIAAYKKPVKSDDINMGIDDNPSNDPPPKGAGIKYAILTFYVLVNLGFLITFVVFVAFN